MSSQPFEVVSDDLILAAPKGAERHRERRDETARSALDLVAQPTRTKWADPSCVRSLPRYLRGQRAQLWLGVAACTSVFLLAQAQYAQAIPVNLTPPVISGTPEVGQILTASPGTWRDSSSPVVFYGYEWSLCPGPGVCVGDGYATSSYWELPWEAFDDEVEVTVVATDEEGELGVAAAQPTPRIGYSGPRYAVSESVAGSGFVRGRSAGRPDSNLLCPGQCGYAYFIPGEDIELVAEPALGATFLGWGGACSGSSPTCSLTLGGNESVTARFTALPAPTSLPEGRETDTLPAGAAAGVEAIGQGGEVPASSVARLPARLLGLSALHGHHLQATVACQQARPCHLTIAVSSDAPSARLVASRTLTLAAGRRTHIGLALNHEGARLLGRRHRLPVTAHLMLRNGRRSIAVGGARLTLTA